MSTDSHPNRETMDRRAFLQSIGGGIFLLTLLPAGCGSSQDQNTGQVCDGLQVRSSVTESHAHDLCISMKDLNSPPAAGDTIATSTYQAYGSGGYDGGGGTTHFHLVSLTADDLTHITGGQTVTVVSALAEDHNHTFNIHM